MTVPFIDLKRFEPGFIDTFTEKVRNLTSNTSFVGGGEVQQLEETLCKENGVKHAIACANGTDALQLALRAAGVGAGDTVLLPDLTFWATFEAVVNVGANPVTVDVSEIDLQMDFDLLTKAVDQYKPKAVLLVHLYGWASSRLVDFRSFCKSKGISLIEDGAQCYGVELVENGKATSSIYKDALLSTISFYPAKTLGAAGDGGAVLTNDDELAQKIRSLGNHGRSEHYAHGLVGWNSRMDSFQAAFLNLAHTHFDQRLKSRRETAKRYQQELPKLGWNCMKAPANVIENGYLNVTLHQSEKRPKIEATLKEKSIGFGIVYPGAVSDQHGAKPFIKGQIGGEIARKISASVLNLPLFPYMTDQEFDEVIQVCKQLS